MPVGDHHMQGQVPFARKDKSRWKPGTCKICDIEPQHLIELNLLLADPRYWPRTVFEGIDLPKGLMPPRYRLWGAAKLGEEWLKEHGYSVNRVALRRHINRHVPWTGADLSDPVVQGAMVEANNHLVNGAPATITAANFRRYYDKGIAVGERGLDLLLRKVEEAEKNGVELPTDLLLKLADLGAKLASSAANLAVKGVELERNKEQEIEGFRAGAGPLPSRPAKHHRIHVIEGEARPVVDEGRADRREHNERAREEGGVELPA